MMNKLITLLTPLMLIALSGCSINYSDEMKEVLVPMQQKVKTFYSNNNQRFPTLSERNALLAQSGCQMQGDICRYDGDDFLVSSETEIYKKKIDYYSVDMSLDKSHCSIIIFVSGKISRVYCQQESFIKIRQ